MAAAQLKFPASHPVFPGHFPGVPMVPGALLLAAAMEALGADGPGTRIAAAKFLHPVAPEELVEVQRVGAGRLELRVAGRLVASATLQAGNA